jgi:hypothetical protein
MRPSNLPKVRDQVLRHLDNPSAPVRAHTGQHNQDGLDTHASYLRAAELYWAAPDMAALAMSAGVQLAAASWTAQDRPAPHGLMVFDGGIGNIDYNGVPVPVEALTWGPGHHGCDIGLWLTRTTLAERISRFAVLETDEVPPLIPLASHVLPATTEPVPFASLPGNAPAPVVAALAAAWLLMNQPTLVERTTEPADKATTRAYKRRQQPTPGVTLIDLRRAYAPDNREETGTDPAGRHYRHRWVVQGHWRDQPHGPERSLRRRQWIPAHIKGPDGAPMLATERVNVWRR